MGKKAFGGGADVGATFARDGLTGFTARRLIVSRMDRLRSTIDATNVPAIRRFRRLHLTGMIINVCLIAGMIWALAASSGDVVSCTVVPAGCQGRRMPISVLAAVEPGWRLGLQLAIITVIIDFHIFLSPQGLLGVRSALLIRAYWGQCEGVFTT